jgi:hypothetical protein
MKKKMFLSIAVLMLFTISLQAQNPLDIIDQIKEADSWIALVGLYTTIVGALSMLFTSLMNLIPGLKSIRGKYLAGISVAVIVLSGIGMFGIGSLWSTPVIWSIITLIWDKIFKAEDPKPTS